MHGGSPPKIAAITVTIAAIEAALADLRLFKASNIIIIVKRHNIKRSILFRC